MTSHHSMIRAETMIRAGILVAILLFVGCTSNDSANNSERSTTSVGVTEEMAVERATEIASTTEIPEDTQVLTVTSTVNESESALVAALSPEPKITTTTAITESTVGTVLAATFVEQIDAADVDQASQFFYPAGNVREAAYDVVLYRLQIQSSTETGDPIDLQADLYLPVAGTEMAERETPLPMLAYAPGTTGIGDGCAPSQETPLGRAWGGYYTQMLSYAGQGFISVLPDGMSYDDPQRPHEYFVTELEAHTMLDAIRGARNFLADPPEGITEQTVEAIFLAGYSNGGHTAFAAKDFAADYAPELPIQGVISHGATTNVETLMREAPLFTPYLVYAYQFYYGDDVITPEQVFAPRWLPTFAQDVNTKCVDEIFVYYNNDPKTMYNDDFRNLLENEALAAQMPLFKAVLDANYAGTFGGFDIPAVFFQGTADATVTPLAQQQFARDLCAKEESVTYTALPTVRHVDTRQRSFTATIDWMQTIIEGGTPQNDCAELTVE